MSTEARVNEGKLRMWTEALSIREIEIAAQARGVAPAFMLAGRSAHVIGLCPRCKEAIALSLCNGGKLSPPRTLHAFHVFSDQVKCEPPVVQAELDKLSPEEKVRLFRFRHDLEVCRGGMNEAEAVRRAEELNPGPSFASFPSVKSAPAAPPVSAQ